MKVSRVRGPQVIHPDTAISSTSGLQSDRQTDTQTVNTTFQFTWNIAKSYYRLSTLYSHQFQSTSMSSNLPMDVD